jgi:hypothetical protein
VGGGGGALQERLRARPGGRCRSPRNPLRAAEASPPAVTIAAVIFAKDSHPLLWYLYSAKDPHPRPRRWPVAGRMAAGYEF